MGVINLGILVEKIKRKLLKSGFVTNTDFASTTSAGVIKVQTAGGTSVSSGSGVLISVARTMEQYNSGATNMFISKGTLENVKTQLTASALGAIADSAETAAAGTVWTGLTLTKTASGYEISFTTVTPP